MMRISLPEYALVLLFGDSFAAVTSVGLRSFEPGALCQPGVADYRLKSGRVTVINASDLSRNELMALGVHAKSLYAQVYAIAVHSSLETMEKRLASLSIAKMHVLTRGEPYEIRLRPVSTDRRAEPGPFDIIGDVHGCADELIDLLGKLGYRVTLTGEGDQRRAEVERSHARRAFFVGDLVDRGPRSPDVLRIVMAMVADGAALCVTGNHDVGFRRWLEGHNPHLKHGLDRTAEQMAAEPAAFLDEVASFLGGLKAHLWVDGGRLAIAHAGIKAGMIGRSTGAVRAFALYGDTDTAPGADGLPQRFHWALDYAGNVAVVYGHTPVADVAWVNNTLCIDTGCCFGGRLTALQWPERTLVSVLARHAYADRSRPFGHPPPRPKAV